jgi:hypothetical protein
MPAMQSGRTWQAESKTGTTAEGLRQNYGMQQCFCEAHVMLDGSIMRL